MTRIFHSLPLLLVLAACGYPKPQFPAPATPPAPCAIDLLRPLEGRPGSAVLAAEALAQSGARIVRFIRPKEAVTMDMVPDRLNIHVSKRNKVKSFSCG